MNTLLVILLLGVSLGVAVAAHPLGAPAMLVCAAASGVTVLAISRSEHKVFLLQIFGIALLFRMVVGTALHLFHLQEFFGGDANTYDELGYLMTKVWSGEIAYVTYKEYLGPFLERNWGMVYVVGGIYAAIGRNMLAVQFFNAVLGAATAPLIFVCAHHIFGNVRVAKVAAIFVALYPSLILWSSQGLKDGPIVFLLAVIMLATFKLGERLSIKYFSVLALALVSILTLRFYIFYMAVAAVVGAFFVGMHRRSAPSLIRQIAVIIGIGLVFTYLGVLRTATQHIEDYADLDRIQLSRADLASQAGSGFGKDIDVSTTSGALTAIPVGMVYLLFAPFPWQIANLRQSITLPEMLIWWASFPLLVVGTWFTIKFRLRQALPILIFTTMLTLAYSIFQGNVGTAYRQRSQIMVFYFIFVAVGVVLVKERSEGRQQDRLIVESAQLKATRALQASRARQAPRGPVPVRQGNSALPESEAVAVRSAPSAGGVT